MKSMLETAATAPFDRLAVRYDELWSNTAIGRSQREAVWRRVDRLFAPGDRVLDLGCGTGTDAIHLMNRGIHVVGVDSSPGMVRIARQSGVDARLTRIEELGALEGRFDGALSNFGALNCVPELERVARDLARLLRSRGKLALCLMSPCCAWEIAWYLLKGSPALAFRRFHTNGTCASIGAHVYYPTIDRLARAFGGNFRLEGWCGIGLAVPPSFVHSLSESAVETAARLDRRLAHLPGLRALCDHRLVIFERI